MKQALLAIILIISIGMAAQPPQGGRGMGGNRGGGPPMRGQMNGDKQSNEGFWVMHLPEISDLTQDQRRKLIENLSKEQENISKLVQEKKELEAEMNKATDPSKKDMDKWLKKIGKIDDKIIQTGNDYEKKYRKILTVEQYMVFREKKKEIQFKRPRRDGRFPQHPDGERPPRPDLEDMTSRVPVFDAESGEIL